MKIAVIDDERPARKMLIRRVKEVRPDCEITEAESGSDALRCLMRRISFDLIFVDMDLGDMEGMTLAATAKRLFPGAKIVFATAYSQYAAKAYEMEIDDYILKPFDPERVHHVVKKCIGEGKLDPAWQMEEQEGKRNRQQQKTGSRAGKHRYGREARSSGIRQDPCDGQPRNPVSGDRQIVYAETDGHGCVVHTTSRSYESTNFWENLRKSWRTSDSSGSIRVIS